MKTIHKRLYTALPRSLASSPSGPTTSSRVRSNSACSSRSLYTASSSSLPFSFFDSPAPPPSSRPGSTNLVVSTRLAAEVKAESEPHSNSPYNNSGQHNTPQAQSHSSGPPPYPLAFSSGQSDNTRHLPSSHYNLFFPYPSFGPGSSWHSTTTSGYDAHPSKRQRTRYHLDVGAYGIPKRSQGARVAGRDGRTSRLLSTSTDPAILYGDAPSQSVQVGEDAYFVRDNAMGVADGVGGWSRVRQASGRADDPTPSALFARRLMHYCCEEVDAALARPGLSDSSAAHSGEHETLLHDQLEDQLEDLADGLDVLMILERAFEKTIKAHVVAGPSTGVADASRPATPQDAGTARDHDPSAQPPLHGNTSHATAHAPGSSVHETSEPGCSNRTVPLMEGSSTALLAILEHPPATPASPASSKPRPLFNVHPRTTNNTPKTNADAEKGAVIRIAHLGDCVAMLIRGEEIVWRTEEMWWNFNTPVQLGPTSSTKPQDAQVYTVPVQEDDILILASDGLSDNLWDEDILDEVVRFRRSFLSPSPSPSPSTSTSSSSTSASSVSSSGASTPSLTTSPRLDLRRSSLAGMLSEALCSRARCVSERRGHSHAHSKHKKARTPTDAALKSASVANENADATAEACADADQKARTKTEPSVTEEDDIPFGRRAREQGRCFRGGKPDDISVLVAVVSPVD